MPQGKSNLGALHQKVAELCSAGKFEDAIPLAKRLAALVKERYGTDHPDHAEAMTLLGSIYLEQGRYSEAEPLLASALSVAERALGFDDIYVSRISNNLAGLYLAQGRLAESQPLFERTLAIREKALGSDRFELVPPLNNIAWVYKTLGRYRDAEQLFKRALAILERPTDADEPNALLRGTPSAVVRGSTLNNLAELYREQGRYADAEPLFKLALEIREEVLGLSHLHVGTTLNNLGLLYEAQGRYLEAAPLLSRALAIREEGLGPDHEDVARSLVNLAALLRCGVEQDRLAAVQLYERAIPILEKALGVDHPDVGQALSNCAVAYGQVGRHAEAEQLLKCSLGICETVLGPDNPSMSFPINNLAALYQEQGRNSDAEALYMRALSVFEKTLGLDHPNVASTLNNLGSLFFSNGEWERAVEFFQRAEDVTARHHVLNGDPLTGSSSAALALHILVKAAHRLAEMEIPRAQDLMQQMFLTAQRALASKTSMSLALMAERGVKDQAVLSELLREQQDLAVEWELSDKQLTTERCKVARERDGKSEKSLSARLALIRLRMNEIHTILTHDFPDYAAFVSPEPLSVTEVRGLLQEDEALVLFLDTSERTPVPEETFVWVVTKAKSRWFRSGLGTKGLSEAVQALRCGLDYQEAWAKCADLLGVVYTEADHKAGKPLPFDLARAHELYRTLLGQIGEISSSKHLLIVPSGPLTQLPFHVLVSETSNSDNGQGQFEALRNAAWLVKSHAITILPGASSLKALRQHAKASRATKPLIAFGNPLLDGPDARYADLANAARQKQRCHDMTNADMLVTFRPHLGAKPIAQRGGLVDVAQIRAQVPLPETADELCAAARALGASTSDIYLGARATERAVKILSQSGRLATYRIVHFATHGCLAGEMHDDAEPGLILTPPETATAEDDGYLTASEIVGLKLDANWVILSACNTAAGSMQGAEALSGLARAFFYAGTRALLVSHWAVNSVSAVNLITKTLNIMSTDTDVGRSEALRRAMLTMIECGEPREVHPSCWAPFVVVGEGNTEHRANVGP